jgi:hypothetical protein
MSPARFKLGVSWTDRPQTLGEFVDVAVCFITQLRPLHPIFAGPLFMTGRAPNENEQMAPDLSNVETFAKRFGWNRKGDDEPHTGLLPDRTMAREGTSRLGFRCRFNSSGLKLKPTSVDVAIYGGTAGTRMPCIARIDFPREGSPEFESLDFVKKLLDVTVRGFEAEFGYVSSTEFHEALMGEDKPPAGRGYHESIGWMHYFANPAVRCDVPPDIECETFGPGGVLLTLQRERPAADDSAAVAHATAVREALLPGKWFEFEKVRRSLMPAAIPKR